MKSLTIKKTKSIVYQNKKKIILLSRDGNYTTNNVEKKHFFVEERGWREFYVCTTYDDEIFFAKRNNECVGERERGENIKKENDWRRKERRRSRLTVRGI